MTTAIVVANSEGIVGRCDAKCHYAAEPDCDCICGGRLHGTGRQAIEQNTRDLLGDELADALKAFAERNGLEADELEARFPTMQAELF